jgi:hypothetical protein
MGMAELTATWSTDHEHLGALDVEVRSGPFAGHGYAWFDKAYLKTFIAALKAYPLDPRSPPLLEGNDGVSVETTKSVQIMVTPYDRRGTLLVRVDLASGGSHEPGYEHTMTARFVTEYGLLARFAEDLEALLDGAKDVAILRSQVP